MSTLTTANSVLSISIAGLYPVAQTIQGFSTDDAFAFDVIRPAEALMGVDAKLSAGYIPFPTPMEIMLQADSASNQFFDDWLAAMKVAREVYVASAILIYPSLSKIFTFKKGYLTEMQQIASAKKLLQPRRFQITWEDCSVAPQ